MFVWQVILEAESGFGRCQGGVRCGELVRDDELDDDDGDLGGGEFIRIFLPALGVCAPRLSVSVG